jgi:hypothetical protein
MKGDEELWIFLNTSEEGDHPNIVAAVAENEEREDILNNIAERLKEFPNETVYLYGTVNEGQYKEYLTDVDFLIIAVGMYRDQTKRHQYIVTDYGESARDALSTISWSEFIKTVGKAGIKAVKP